MPVEACDSCLCRAWLLSRLAGHIERAAAGPGRRVGEILALDDGDLVAALAPKDRGEIERELDRLDPGRLRAESIGGGSWSTCRHAPMFPTGLADLGDPPAALFGRGDRALLERLTPRSAVTVVGSRRATVYGLGVAKDLGRELSMAGLTVVSGMAMGIDGAAHQGALEAGLSCAVLGCGVDRVYPARHRRLYERHVEGGLVLSELPTGARPWRWTFPARNRLMAAMSGMTIVVEATHGSGSLITATIAQELGRDLGAVPGPVTSRASHGPNELLGAGACVVRGARDVLDALLGVGAAAQLVDRGPTLTPELAAALDSFERHDGDRERIDSELRASGISPEAGFAQLELFGYLRCSDLGSWSRTSLRRPT